ncbi:MAG: Dabb family protein [Muribaculaceae bacterium]|nr:Dabb family protein [Muribaculaceae bacterium]
MVKHIVMFKLNGDAETRSRIANQFAEALMALPEKITCLRSMEVGINSNPAEDWDLVLTAIVGSMAEVSEYATHPDHVAAASIVAPYKAARACVDYEC